ASSARRRASPGAMPRSMCFCVSRSMWNAISSSSSRSMRARPSSAPRAYRNRSNMCVAPSKRPSGRAQHPLDRGDVLAPRVRLVAEHAAAFGGEAVVLGAAVVVRRAPLGCDAAALLEALQREVERALVDVEHAARRALDALRDAPAVHGFER